MHNIFFRWTAGVILLALLVKALVMTGFFNRYHGHNGYYFAWRDFKRVYSVVSDLNGDSNVSRDEVEAVKKDFLIRNELYTVGGSNEMYLVESGKEISARCFVYMFRKDLDTILMIQSEFPDDSKSCL